MNLGWLWSPAACALGRWMRRPGRVSTRVVHRKLREQSRDLGVGKKTPPGGLDGSRPPDGRTLHNRLTTRSTIPAKDRILDVAYRRFSRQGVRAVGIDAIIAQAEVAKMTFYRHFPTKDALVMAFLERREQLWPVEWVEAEVRSRDADPKQRLHAKLDGIVACVRLAH